MSLKRGFTLMELMVAVACAAILAASAWSAFGMYIEGRRSLLLSYQRESQTLIQELKNSRPYDSRTGRRRNTMYVRLKS